MGWWSEGEITICMPDGALVTLMYFLKSLMVPCWRTSSREVKTCSFLSGADWAVGNPPSESCKWRRSYPSHRQNCITFIFFSE